MADGERAVRVLVAGIDARGRSCVVGHEVVPMETNPDHPGFRHAQLFETPTSPPSPRPAGRGEHLEMGLTPGLVRWQVIDYGASLGYPMHHTDTIDFDTVLEGSIELTLDDGIHLLRTGDGAVITGVDHAWKAGPEGCRLSVLSVATPSPSRP